MKDKATTIRAKMGDNQPAVCYAIEGNGIRPSHFGGGYSGEGKMYTLNTIEQRIVCFQQNQREEVRNMGEKAGSLTAKSGIHNTNYVCYPDKARSLTARHDSSPCVDRGQNIVCVLASDCEESERGVRVWDARGNGNGTTVPTLTGNHQDRITDYTAVTVYRK